MINPAQIEQTYRGIIASERQRVRLETIEECARVAENNIESTDRFELVAMIRALRDK